MHKCTQYVFVHFAYCTHHEICAILISEVITTGKTSSAVKDRYNAKAYDEIKVRVDKGQKEKIKAHAETFDGGSVNAFINRAISEMMERDTKGGEPNV